MVSEVLILFYIFRCLVEAVTVTDMTVIVTVVVALQTVEGNFRSIIKSFKILTFDEFEIATID